MTPEALKKGKEIEKELDNYSEALENLSMDVFNLHRIGDDIKRKLTEEAKNLIKSKLKARIEELEKELEAL